METLAILIPVKNNANIVARALDSVVNQTAFLNGTFKYQIFLVDNDSSDNLKQVVSKYKNLTYLSCKVPGIVAALNTGIFHIMSLPHIKYIARIDSDDMWLPNKIEIQFSYMLENPNIDICGTAIRFIRGSSFQEWLYGETHNQIIEDTGVLWLKASTRGEGKGDSIQGKGWQLKQYGEIATNFKMFQNIYEIYKMENPDFKPMTLLLPTSVKLSTE